MIQGDVSTLILVLPVKQMQKLTRLAQQRGTTVKEMMSRLVDTIALPDDADQEATPNLLYGKKVPSQIDSAQTDRLKATATLKRQEEY